MAFVNYFSLLRQCGSFYKMAKLACSTLLLTARDYYTCMLVIFAECTVPLAELGNRLNFVVAEVSLVEVVFPNNLQLPAEQCLVSVPHLFTSINLFIQCLSHQHTHNIHNTHMDICTHAHIYVHTHTPTYPPHIQTQTHRE